MKGFIELASGKDRKQQPSLAEQIVAAGKAARGVTSPPKPTGLALEIVNAARRARGEPEL